jgi:hypothetical protein
VTVLTITPEKAAEIYGANIGGKAEDEGDDDEEDEEDGEWEEEGSEDEEEDEEEKMDKSGNPKSIFDRITMLSKVCTLRTSSQVTLAFADAKDRAMRQELRSHRRKRWRRMVIILRKNQRAWMAMTMRKRKMANGMRKEAKTMRRGRINTKVMR